MPYSLNPYRGTSLMRNSTPLGPYSRTMSREGYSRNAFKVRESVGCVRGQDAVCVVIHAG